MPKSRWIIIATAAAISAAIIIAACQPVSPLSAEGRFGIDIADPKVSRTGPATRGD